ncbi:hypothetical protein [Trinickia sp.]|uniref:hypothetical protein n=1 Tax=Trinickia sp. TaxID=2571163 RepID=UPI003F7ED418
MTTLVIHDLPESIDLDRQAMAAITGGSMVQARQTLFVRRHSLTGLPQLGFSTVSEAGPLGQIDQPLRTTLLR